MLQKLFKRGSFIDLCTRKLTYGKMRSKRLFCFSGKNCMVILWQKYVVKSGCAHPPCLDSRMWVKVLNCASKNLRPPQICMSVSIFRNSIILPDHMIEILSLPYDDESNENHGILSDN